MLYIPVLDALIHACSWTTQAALARGTVRKSGYNDPLNGFLHVTSLRKFGLTQIKNDSEMSLLTAFIKKKTHTRRALTLVTVTHRWSDKKQVWGRLAPNVKKLRESLASVWEMIGVCQYLLCHININAHLATNIPEKHRWVLFMGHHNKPGLSRQFVQH